MPVKKILNSVISATFLTIPLIIIALVQSPHALHGETLITLETKIVIMDDENQTDARERAINALKETAILKKAEAFSHPAILLREKKRLLQAFQPQQEALVEEVKILSEEDQPEKIYAMKAAVQVNGPLLEDLLMKNLNGDRAIVITAEKNLLKPLKRQVLEHDLINAIKKKGYAIVDYRTIKNPTVNKLVAAIRQGNTEAVRKLGRYYLTDLVIVGFVETKFSEKTQDICSSHATGQVKIHRIGSRKELASLTKHDVKGFGGAEEKSGLDAIKKISRMMSEEAMKSMPAKAKK